MKRAYFCRVCKAPISGQGKLNLCRKCARARRPKTVSGGKIETVRASVLAGIKENMKTYGIRLECRRCDLDCKQTAFPRSGILFCPKMAERQATHA